MGGEDPGIVGLDGAGAEDRSCRGGDHDGSVLLSVHHVAEGSKGTNTDEFDS